MNLDRLKSLWLRTQTDGVKKILVRRWHRFKKYWTLNNYFFGRIVELSGNHVRFESLNISVDNPRISTRRKSDFFFRLYEKDEIRAINRYLRPDLPVIELGGGIGVVSCIVNQQLECPEKHIVLEADPELLITLEANRRLNNCRFVTKSAALGYGSDSVVLHVSEIGTSSLYKVANTNDALQVPAVSLKHILANAGLSVATLIMDIEGGEADLIEQEIVILKNHIHMIFFEVHVNQIGISRWNSVRDLLTASKFSFVERFIDTYVYKNTRLRC